MDMLIACTATCPLRAHTLRNMTETNTLPLQLAAPLHGSPAKRSADTFWYVRVCAGT